MISGGNHIDLGRRGEQQACDYLVSLGHTVLSRNWRAGHCELDIVTLCGDGVHFVEVKDRRCDRYLDGSVDERKQRHLATAARRYMALHRQLCEMESFFDVILIVDGSSLEYIPQAFFPTSI